MWGDFLISFKSNPGIINFLSFPPPPPHLQIGVKLKNHHTFIETITTSAKLC